MGFPDPEGVVVAYLNAWFASLGRSTRAATYVPTPRPVEFVRVILTGAVRESVSHRAAQVTVECWAGSGPAAAALADDVYDALAALDVGGSHVPQGPDGWVGGPYSQPDPDTGSPRYVMTAILRQRQEPT